MITQKEIIDIANKHRVKTSKIDKDWVLGHFLNAMYSLDIVNDNFVFKGGTCLKKCYIEDYRFSEDLDFTLIDNSIVIDSKLINRITKIATKNSGAHFYFEKKKVQLFRDEEQGYEVKVKFWGADHNPNKRPLPSVRWQTSIKLDISYSEEIITNVEKRPIYHNYSDDSIITNVIPVYSIIEIISEKLRSLIQRNRPRDIYDLWTLSGLVEVSDYSEIKRVLIQKADNKGIKFNSIEEFINESKGRKNSRAWTSSLGDHLPLDQLPDFNEIYSKISIFVDKIINS